mgnify:CR=1 FL=1
MITEQSTFLYNNGSFDKRMINFIQHYSSFDNTTV